MEVLNSILSQYKYYLATHNEGEDKLWLLSTEKVFPVEPYKGMGELKWAYGYEWREGSLVYISIGGEGLGPDQHVEWE